METYILSILTFLPVAGIVAILFIPKENKEIIKIVAAVATGIQLLLAIQLVAGFQTGVKAMQFVEHYQWIPKFNIEYFLGVDGLSVPLVFLTALLSFLVVFASWNIPKATKGYFALFLLLDTGMMGVFVSLDFFLFYIFWEVMLLPMYFLIGLWGGPKREYAAIKFFLYTLFGSVLMLLAMLALYFSNDPHTFNMLTLIENSDRLTVMSIWGFQASKVVFLALFIGFAIKVPVFPFHTWLPLAHVEAPTAISVILAGVLLKMGTYGMLRISFPMLPDATLWFAGALAVLGMINIIWGAMCALAQTDLKRLVAYSSINHMGYVMLGMAAIAGFGSNLAAAKTGLTGAYFQMFNHGTITAMLFLLVGVVYDRAHHRNIDGFGGLAVKTPLYAGVTAFAFFAGLGLPALSGFISEALCFLGAFPVFRTITIISGIGILLNAAYFLWAYQRVFLGPLNEKYANLEEINGREMFTLVPLMVIILFFGVYPAPFIDLVASSVDQLIEWVQVGAQVTLQ
jgi:NADH-quinone oxidoreductase subunit M